MKYAFTLDEYGSKVQRSVEETLLLRERGRQHYVLRLRGYLFFGSVVRLVHDVRQRITIRVPRDVNLSIVDISGRVRAGAVGGTLEVADISGMVSVQEAGG